MKRTRSFAAFASAVVCTLPVAAIAQTVSVGGSGSASASVGLGGALTSVTGILSGLLGSVTGVLGGLGL